MSEFLKEDYVGMLINVNEADVDKDYLVTFPELRLYPEFSKNMDIIIPSKVEGDPPRTIRINRNMVIKFIALTYDKNSPFRKKYSDPLVRKVHCIQEAGFKMKDGKFPREIEDIIEMRNLKAVDMTIAYIKHHNNIDYSHFLLLEGLYYGKLKDVQLNSLAPTIRVAELDNIKKTFQQAEKDLLGNDTSKMLAATLYKAVNQDKIDLSPESIATKIKEKGTEGVLNYLEQVQ